MEPLIVVSFLTFGTIVNRNKSATFSGRTTYSGSLPAPWEHLKYPKDPEFDDVESARPSHEHDRALLGTPLSRASSSSGATLADDGVPRAPSPWRQRKLKFMSWEREVTTPNTEVFINRFLSRVLQRLPFLAEVWYWALIYWV